MCLFNDDPGSAMGWPCSMLILKVQEAARPYLQWGTGLPLLTARTPCRISADCPFEQFVRKFLIWSGFQSLGDGCSQWIHPFGVTPP